MNCLNGLSPIYLFQGEGIGPISVANTVQMFEKYVENPIIKIDYSALQRRLEVGTLVMPGGYAIEQMERLCSFGFFSEKIVLERIKSGDNYLGICAGAYIGTKYLLGLAEAHFLIYRHMQITKR